MSRKSKRKNNKPVSLPLVALIAGGVLLVVALFIFNRPDEISEQGGNGTPALVVDQDRIDYGDVKLDTPLAFTIKVTNTGDGDLRFTQDPYIEVVEGC